MSNAISSVPSLAPLSVNKQDFFSAVRQNRIVTYADIENQANLIGYDFLIKHQDSLLDEFTSMFRFLQKQGLRNNKAFWFYAYYCACLAESLHRAYGQEQKAEEFKEKQQQIKDFLEQKEKDAEKSKAFFEALYNDIIASLTRLIKSPLHTSSVRDYVAYANACRLYWAFCKLTIIEGLRLASDAQLIDKLDKLLHTHTDINKIIGVMQAPTGVINYFSVLFFLFRFLIDAGLLIRHTFFPQGNEKNVPMWNRFKRELHKRHCRFLNDITWAIVNFLTNFNQVCGISGPMAGYLTSVFLVFDVCVVLYQCELAKAEYLERKSQITREREWIFKSEDMPQAEKNQHLALLNRELADLEVNWHKKEATFYFVAAAASLLVLGFTAAMLVSSGILLAASFFLCLLGVAMYLSSGSYAKYKEKAFYLEQSELENPDLVIVDNLIARKEYETARNDFIFTMVKNIAIPGILITTFAICWPAAIILSALYMGYELLQAYCQHSGNEEAKQLALDAPSQQAEEGSLALNA